jgi:uncharacterized membrane protein
MAWYYWLILVAVILIIIGIIRSSVAHYRLKEDNDPMIRALKEKYINGEISQEEYEEKRAELKRKI